MGRTRGLRKLEYHTNKYFLRTMLRNYPSILEMIYDFRICR